MEPAPLDDTHKPKSLIYSKSVELERQHYVEHMLLLTFSCFSPWSSHKRKAVPRKIVKDDPAKEDTVKEEMDL